MLAMKSTLQERLKAARKEAGKTQKQVANAIGMRQPTYSELETGKSLGSKRLPEIADYLNVIALWLSSGKGPKHKANVEPGPQIKSRIPLISWVQAGDWAESPDIYAPGDAEDWLPSPIDHAEHVFALRVSGPSMDDGTANGYRDGEIIYVDPDAEWQHNNDVVVKNGGGEMTFKRIVCQGEKCHLVPLNPNWPDKIIPVDRHCSIIGKVVFSGKER